MADTSKLKHYTFPRATPNSFFAVVSDTDDPDISIDVGTPVSPVLGEPGNVLIATGDTENNSLVVGLAASANEGDQRISVQYAGPLSQPTDWWDRLTGQTGGLTTGSRYYLTNDPKVISTDSDGVTFPVQLGIALSPDTLMIQILRLPTA